MPFSRKRKSLPSFSSISHPTDPLANDKVIHLACPRPVQPRAHRLYENELITLLSKMQHFHDSSLNEHAQSAISNDWAIFAENFRRILGLKLVTIHAFHRTMVEVDADSIPITAIAELASFKKSVNDQWRGMSEQSKELIKEAWDRFMQDVEALIPDQYKVMLI
ncbi:hypothetical protein JX266_010474 [Neoarthrinium moseri]|nr:hypothetical protein JX266_010474 [Neoarthrinium moseri]